MYRSRTAQLTIVAFVFIGVICQNSPAQEGGQEFDVRYSLHDVPDDPNTPVVWMVDLELLEDQTVDNEVAWSIRKITLREYDEFGEPTYAWAEEEPEVDTSDGLWWIEHADPEDPDISEFTAPPAMEGTAVTGDPNDPELDYYFEGIVADPPPANPPFETTGVIDCLFILPGMSLFERDNEMSDLPHPIEDPPIG